MSSMSNQKKWKGLLYLIIILVAISVISSMGKKSDSVSNTGTETRSMLSIEATERPSNVLSLTKEPTASPKPTATPKPTASPKPTATITQSPTSAPTSVSTNTQQSDYNTWNQQSWPEPTTTTYTSPVTNAPQQSTAQVSRQADGVFPTATVSTTPVPGTNYVLNTSSMVFHRPTCSSVKTIAEGNRYDYFGTYDEVTALGFRACQRCNPK